MRIKRIIEQIIIPTITYIIILIPEFIIFLIGMMTGKVLSDYLGWIGFQRYLLQFLTYHFLRKYCTHIIKYITGGKI